MTTRPFKVLGIQQVAVGAADKNALRRLWVDTLGLTPHGNFKSAKENVDEDIVTMGAGPFTVEVDLMQPIDPAKKPRVDTPPRGWASRACGSRQVVFAWARRATVSASSTPRATRRPRSAVKAC